MSLQLKLKPQFYEGYGNDISVISGEMIANGNFFQGVNTLAGITNTSTNIVPDIITNFPPASPNTWNRFKSNAATTMPTVNLLVEFIKK